MAYETLELNENGELVVKKDIADKIKDLDKQIKELTNEQKKLKNSVSAEISKISNFGGTYGTLQYQVSPAYLSLEFDIDLFKQENTELYNKYLVPTYKAESTKLVFVRVKKGE